MTVFVVLDESRQALAEVLEARSLADRAGAGVDRVLFLAGDPACVVDVALPAPVARQLRVSHGRRRLAVLLSFVADVRAMYSDASAR